MFWDGVPQGTASRWAIGILIIIHLIAYNESGPTGATFAVTIAFIHAIFSVFCKNGLKTIQIPYIRATNRIDFLILYLALWMEILSLLAACGALVRTLSTSLDAMTGGLARLYILGRNATESEPWPDVVGVAIVFLVTGMFMLGLENTKIFSVLMVSSVFGAITILIIVIWSEGTVSAWTDGSLFPTGMTKLLSSSALLVFIFPHELPTTGGRYRKLYGMAMTLVVMLSNVLVAIGLSTIVKFSPRHAYEAVPLILILEQQQFSKLIPAVACLLVISTSGAIMELFPELYSLIVQLASTEWKILAKPIAYENRESGSPCLAVFIAGSLCGILAFACPLEHMTYILAGSHLSADLLRALYFLYSPYRPKFMVHHNDSATLSYSRLTTIPQSGSGHSRSTKIIQFLRKKSLTQSYNHLSTKTKKPNEEVEREWLLLGEPPASPRIMDHNICTAESSILSDDNATTDTECIGTVKPDNTDSDSSEDIDAIVNEYREKVKVTTAGPLEATIKLPTMGSWRAMYVILVLFVGSIIMAGVGACYKLEEAFFGGIVAAIFFSFSALFLPKYNNDHTPSLFTCSMCMLTGGILLITTFEKSWLALALWFTAGIIFYIRCDTWCCLCLDNRTGTESLLPTSASSSKFAAVRLPSGLPAHGVMHDCR